MVFDMVMKQLRKSLGEGLRGSTYSIGRCPLRFCCRLIWTQHPPPSPTLAVLATMATPLPSRLVFLVSVKHRLNMEVDLQSLFGLHVMWCAQQCSLAETPQLPPPPHLDSYTRALFVSKVRRHLFVTPCCKVIHRRLNTRQQEGGRGKSGPKAYDTKRQGIFHFIVPMEKGFRVQAFSAQSWVNPTCLAGIRGAGEGGR